MKFLRLVVIVFLLLETKLAQADDPKVPEYNAQDVVIETLILRPLGLVGTIVGSAFFIGTSPLTALVSIAPPHDAFEKAADIYVMTPFNYTFARPFGVYSYDP